MRIKEVSSEPVINIALDTVNINKQALVFVNSKRSAEKSAEDISKKLPINKDLLALKENILNALPKPTKQCERLANCIEHGIAFHHAGLHSKQKELVEDAFRDGSVRIICCTTTMAAGMDLPAFRSIIRDLKRYTHHGMDYIPTLEYHQCAGRAGRPGKEDYGEAIIIAKDEAEKEEIVARFIHGKPENIYSKLAVEPVLRMYVLSLIVSGIVKNREMLFDFFSKTFWAHQYKDMEELKLIIEKMIELLQKWEFLERENDGFVSADEISEGKLKASLLGERVAQLYIDPLTANFLINGIRKAEKEVTDFALLQMVCNTLEMRPLLSVKAREFEEYENFTAEIEEELLLEIPSYFEHEYNEFMDSLKTARMFLDWINEEDEDFLLERYNIRPGETRIKLSMADWLLYSMKELAMILDKKWIGKEIEKLRIRLEYGAKEELLNLLRLKNIGRVRARKLFANGVKTVGDLKKADLSLLSKILGEKTAENVKKQVGQDDAAKNERL